MKESNISNLIEIEAGKRGYITLRLNSGKFYQGTIKNHKDLGTILTQLRHIKGCPEGTSDLVVLKNKGQTIWCEVKTLKGKQRKSQVDFQKAVTDLGHIYIVAKKISDIF